MLSLAPGVHHDLKHEQATRRVGEVQADHTPRGHGHVARKLK